MLLKIKAVPNLTYSKVLETKLTNYQYLSQHDTSTLCHHESYMSS